MKFAGWVKRDAEYVKFIHALPDNWLKLILFTHKKHDQNQGVSKH